MTPPLAAAGLPMALTRALTLALACTAAAAAAAPPAPEPPKPPPADERVDRADIDRTTVTGHQELPKVLYIVPWKKPVPGSVDTRARSSVLDEALAPLDREVFRRQLRYRAQIDNPTPAPQEKTP